MTRRHAMNANVSNSVRVILLAIFFVAGAVFTSQVTAVQPNENGAAWSSYDAAVAQAKKTGRPVMLVFSGSDWCSWCQRMDAEILQTSEFVDWSKSNVIPVEVDFPKHKPLPDALTQKNNQLLTKYGKHVRSYPTVLFVDSNEKVIGQIGFVAGGPNAWIAQAKQFTNRDIGWSIGQ